MLKIRRLTMDLATLQGPDSSGPLSYDVTPCRDSSGDIEPGACKRERFSGEIEDQRRTGRTQAYATVHLALEDATGDSAILEVIGGKLVVHHGRQFQVMTNAHAYDEQLKLLSKRDYKNPTMETQVPGNVNPRDRFQRATYFLSVLTKPKTERAGEWPACSITVRKCLDSRSGRRSGADSTFDTEYRTVGDPDRSALLFPG